MSLSPPTPSGVHKRSGLRQSLLSLMRRHKGFSLRGGSRAAGRFLRTQLWAWPIVAAVLLGVIGYAVNRAVDRTMKQQVASEVETIRDTGATGVRIWLGEQKINAQMAALGEGVLRLVRQLLGREQQSTDLEKDLLNAKEQAELGTYLAPRLKILGYYEYYVVSPSWRVVATSNLATLGKPVHSDRQRFYEKVFNHGASVRMPYRTPEQLPDANGVLKSGMPSMLVAAPIHDEEGKPVAVLALRLRPEEAFTALFRVGSSGKTGETYALDRNGTLLTQSRFDEDLKQIGLLADRPDEASVLTVELRDPGVNMEAGRGRRCGGLSNP